MFFTSYFIEGGAFFRIFTFCSRTSANGTSLQRPLSFLSRRTENPYTDSCLRPLYNSHLFTTATFFWPQGGRFREVQLYIVFDDNWERATNTRKSILSNTWQGGHVGGQYNNVTQKCFQQTVNLAGLIMEEHFHCVCRTCWQKRSDAQYDNMSATHLHSSW